jgi:hypothetical protein
MGACSQRLSDTTKDTVQRLYHYFYIRGLQGKGVKRSRPAVCVAANPAEKKKPLSLVAFVVPERRDDKISLSYNKQ